MKTDRPLVIAILAKSCGHILPLYLDSLLAQDVLSSKTIFYIRTNDNNDNTSEILRDFYNKWKWKYKMVFDDSSIDTSLITQENHDWTYERYKILGKIRQDSCDFALSEGADYFIADADNICLPNTISTIRSRGVDVIAPYLRVIRDGEYYSNYHKATDENGYFAQTDDYYPIWNMSISGLVQVDVVHCTYFISHNVLDKITYDDGSGRMEYVIFSDNLRKIGIPQYLDNHQIYGRVFFSSNKKEFDVEKLNSSYKPLVDTILATVPEEHRISSTTDIILPKKKVLFGPM
jgi:hypothetical protein